MKKFYSSMLAALCLAGTAFAQELPPEDSFSVVTDYTWTIRPTDVLASQTQPTVDIRVQLLESSEEPADDNGNRTYFLREAGGTDYFNGTTVPFIFEASNGAARIDPFDVGVFGTEYIMFSAFLNTGNLAEPQTDGLYIYFTPETGFEFTNFSNASQGKNEGFGWYTLDKSMADGGYPTGLYSGFYLLECAEVSTDFEPDATISGLWTFPLYDGYAGAESLGDFNAEFEVTLDGTIVTFKSLDSEYNMIGEFVSATEIAFDRCIVGNPAARVPLRQIPFVNTTDITEIGELPYTPFKAVYDAVAGTLSFPPDSGMKYGLLDDTWEPHGSSFNPVGSWQAAFDFVGLGRRNGALQAKIELSNVSQRLEGNSILVEADVTPVNFSLTDAAEWKVLLTELTFEGENDITTESQIAVTLSGGHLSFAISDLANGNHDFTWALAAYDAAGDVIAVSPTKAVTYYVGPNIMIRNLSTEAGEGSITVTFGATAYSMPENTVYKVRFTDNATVTDTYAGDVTFVDATLADGTATATINGLEAGRYDFTIALVAYADDAEIAVSNNLTFVETVTSADTSAVGTVGEASDAPVRYFNLQGAEVRNPAPGQILIRVKDGAATKIAF